MFYTSQSLSIPTQSPRFSQCYFFLPKKRSLCHFTASKCSVALDYQGNNLPHSNIQLSAKNFAKLCVLIKPQKTEYMGWPSQGCRIRHGFSHFLSNYINLHGSSHGSPLCPAPTLPPHTQSIVQERVPAWNQAAWLLTKWYNTFKCSDGF